MLQENYLRLSLILNNGNAQTIKTNIVKLMKSVVYTKSNDPLTINEISDFIKEMFGLEFTHGELLNALKYSKYDGFECVQCDDPIYNTYKLIPKEYDKIGKKMSIKTIDDIINCFIHDNSISTFTFEEIRELIFDFLYKAFCSDLKTMESLIGEKYYEFLSNGIFDEIDSKRREIINSFLNWNNETKNKFVYNAISCGFEYCMLGMKKDNNSLRNIFKGKVFYLDCNIIFRLMGLNKIERKNIINAFVEKCVEAGITIKYTNVTLGEINSTIDYHVDLVKNFYGKNPPISKKSIQLLSGKYANLDFIDEYNNWTRHNPKNIGDYVLFNKHLRMTAIKILEPYKIDVYESNESGKNKKEFEELFKELEEYKRLRYKSTYEGSISVDINNYIFIKNKNKDHLGENVFGVNYYLISADHAFIGWAKSRILNIIPIIILPSVWYSIILKYMGRTNDDYNAFCQFLKLNINYDEPDDERKPEILARALEIKESPEIKEEIIYDIASKLKNEYKDIESAEEIILLSTESVIENRVSDVSKTLKVENDSIINKLKQDHDKEIENKSRENYSIGEDKGSKQKELYIYDKIVENSKNKLIIKYIIYWTLRIMFWTIPAIVVLIIGYIINKSILTNYYFAYSVVFSLSMNLFKGEKYINIKEKTDKVKLLESIIQQECKKIDIDYVKMKNYSV